MQSHARQLSPGWARLEARANRLSMKAIEFPQSDSAPVSDQGARMKKAGARLFGGRLLFG